MPIFEPTPAVQDQQTTIPRIVDKTYRTNVVDTRYINRKSLITNIEGRPWQVDYYSQALGSDDQLAGFDVGRNAAREQFIRVRNLTLRVQSPLRGANQDPTDKYLQMTGEAIIPGTIIPNEGDHFVADFGDGRAAIYSVTESEQLSHLTDTAYRIAYRVQGYADSETEFQHQWKVIKTLYEYYDEMRYGQQAIIEEGEYTLLRDFSQTYNRVFEEWSARYWSNEFHTYLVPGAPGRTIYDHFMAQFVRGMYNAASLRAYPNTRVLNCTDDYNVMTCSTVFDAIYKRDPFILQTGIRQCGIASTRTFKFQPIFNSIRYTGIQSVIYPSDGTKKIDYQVYRDETRRHGLFESPDEDFRPEALEQRFGALLKLPGFDLTEQLALIKPVLVDQYYVFSEAFYTGEGTLSVLESQVRQYIEGQAPDPKLINALLHQRRGWGPLEDYYYTPFILMLLYGYSRAI